MASITTHINDHILSLIVCFLHATFFYILHQQFPGPGRHNPQSSGVTLQSDVLDTYKQANSWKYIIFGLVNNNKEIGVIEYSTESDYDKFLEKLPEDDCRFAVYHLEYESGEGKRDRRIFYTWFVPNRLLFLEDWGAD
jgi:hypothetical protein